MPSPNYAILFSALVSGTASTGSPGDVLIPDATTGQYVKATTAARGTRRATGVALFAYAAGGTVDIQQFGQIDTATAGLGAGAASRVIVSTTGSLQRKTTPTTGDDVAGWVEADGTFHAAFGFLTAAIVTGGGLGFTPPTGTGFVTVTAGSLDAAATAEPLSAGLGGTGLSALGTGIATWLGTPSGSNFGAALTSAVPLSKTGSPTGTGLGKVSGGAWVTTAATLVDADVSASAAIAVSKLAPSGTNGWVLTTTGGVAVWAAAGGSGSPGGTTGQVQYNNAGSFGGATNVLTGSGFISIGAVTASVAATGLLRFPYNIGSIAVTLDSGGGDAPMIRGGVDTHFFGSVASTNVSGQGGVAICNQSDTPILNVRSTGILASAQLLGDSSSSSPWGAHGGVVIAPPSNANYTLLATEYCYDWIQVNAGSWLAGHTLLIPQPSDKAHGFYKTIYNASGFTLTVSNGAAPTKTLATGLAQRFWSDPTGINFASATWTP